MASLYTGIGTQADHEYNAYMVRFQNSFSKRVIDARNVFTTDASGLFAIYLNRIPTQDRQYCTCHTCRRFMETYGGLVTIDEKGRTKSLFWTPRDAPEMYQDAISALKLAVETANVTGVFRTKEKIWGVPETGVWTHFATIAPQHLIHTDVIKTPFQAAAELKENFGNVSRALEEWPQNILDTALTLLETDSLYRSEKVKGPVKWLSDLRSAMSVTAGKRRANVLWKAIAEAPAGFCHPRSSMAGTLLDDLASGSSIDAASKRFAAKMHPLAYQRPQALPAAGAVKRAEEIFNKLGLARSLERRFARLDEVPLLWKPSAPASQAVFGGVPTKNGRTTQRFAPSPVTRVTMTWDKFTRVLLPEAAKVEVYVGRVDSFGALLTAVHEDAPKLFQWDHPFSWYVWNGGARPSDVKLKDHEAWFPLSGIALKPSMWSGAYDHQGNGAILLVEGARETRSAGLALFPELLRSELREVRSVIEAYSRRGQLQGMDTGDAVGILISSSGTKKWDRKVRVTNKAGVVTEVTLDRWD